jgi:hypothetical protein
MYDMNSLCIKSSIEAEPSIAQCRKTLLSKEKVPDILNISLSILLQRKQPSIFGRLILSQENKYKPDVPEPRGLCAQRTSNKRHSIIRKSFFVFRSYEPRLTYSNTVSN